jgi:hypothetical protein
MKGKLLKDDMGWFVEYYEELGISKSLPLWREDVMKVEDYISNYHDDLYLRPKYYEGMDVEFEIRIDALSPTWEAFSILIHPEIPRLMYKGGKEIRSYHSPKLQKMLDEINSEEISESEIDAAAKEMFYNNSDSGWHVQFARNCFKEGIKWYKSKLKNVDN